MRKEILKLDKEFRKCEICDIKINRYGKFAIIKFSKETEAKTAFEKLNNEEIAQKKLVVKKCHNYNYNNNPQH